MIFQKPQVPMVFLWFTNGFPMMLSAKPAVQGPLPSQVTFQRLSQFHLGHGHGHGGPYIGMAWQWQV
jgi:hypothetical protein